MAMAMAMAVAMVGSFPHSLPIPFPTKSPSSRHAHLLHCSASSSPPPDQSSSNSNSNKGLLSFVTDNPSSKSAIQLPNTPAQDGNLGQMISEIEDKGRQYGSYKRAGEYSWFVRETGLPAAKNGTVFFMHGAPTQSYSFRIVIEKMAEAGYHCYAPDWLGFGFSERPQPGYDFAYTEKVYHEEFDKLLNRLGVDSPFFLVTQGFIVGSYGLTWALKNPDRISKLVILNSPLTSAAPLPAVFKQLRFPLVGEFTCQNAMVAERFVEGGSTYVLDVNDADVYRLPYLESSDPGFALLECSRKASFKDLSAQIETGFSSGRWTIPTLVAWGKTDKYLPVSEAETFAKKNANIIQVRLLDGAGHMPQEDWPEKVIDVLTRFFQ